MSAPRDEGQYPRHVDYMWPIWKVLDVTSQRVAARCGYVQEGLLRSHDTSPGIREDTYIWSRLPTDP